MILKALISLTAILFSISSYAVCTPAEVSNVNLAKEASNLGAISEAWQFMNNVSDACYSDDQVLEKTLAIFNRTCDFQSQGEKSNLFSFLFHSHSNFWDCYQGLNVLEKVEARRSLSPSELVQRKAFALGMGAGSMQDLPRQGNINFCSQDEVPDFSIRNILISTRNFVASGPSQITFLKKYYTEMTALTSSIGPDDLNAMRSYLQSAEFGIGTCQSEAWWFCCP